ncbi:hypothetical protein [Nonomuraea sp. 10N515B]|uniref:hypothetical protein n=1 Tax=Nonomuraea sp. 10N515B TaxID=3457422 RepID=UPI003FCE52AB
MNLAGLGLTDYEEHVYRMLLREPAVPIPGDSVMAATLARLTGLGLLRRTPPGDIVVVDPQSAVSRLITRRLNETNAEMARITSAWAALPSLTGDARPR